MSNGSTPTDVIARSVTRGDHEQATSGVFYFALPMQQAFRALPAYWSRDRDFALAATIHMESMWASAIGKAITKQASLGWKVDDTDDSKQRTKRAQDLLLLADGGAGWVPFLSKHLRNYLTTDNGAFVEIVRASSGYGSKILGLMHLDSHRVTRTGDPSVPILYRDLDGREHQLRQHQVLLFSDMPDPGDAWRGVGFCAASRAWKTIYKLSGMEQYVSEKITGSGFTAIQLVSGITRQQLEAALVSGEAEKQRSGAILYKGVLVIPGIDPAIAPNVASIPLAEVPDRFVPKEERDNGYIIYANAIGIPVQDIQPLSGQGLGTGTQTVILDEAAEGQGLASWRKQFEHALNEYVLPASTTFTFSTNDIRDQKMKADVQLIRAQTRAAQIGSGEITAPQALQMAVDDGDVPREFLPDDQTPGGTLADNQKPVDVSQQQQPDAAVELPDMITKAKKRPSFRDVAALLEQEHDAAVALFEEVTSGNNE